MLSLSALLSWLALVLSVQATLSSSTVYGEQGVPTGRPIAGSYGGALRPQIHFSPPEYFMVSGLAFHSIETSLADP